MRVLRALVVTVALFGCLAGAQDKKAPVLKPGLYLTFHTSMGEIVAKLYEKETPKTVANFVGLATGTREFVDPKTGQKAKRPFYDGTVFHRVEPGFMIQGGDPTGTGGGGPGYTFEDEILPGLDFNGPGRLAMANPGKENSNGSQFFITEDATRHLNNLHTIFGQVVSGQDLVGKIARAGNGKVTLQKLTFERVEKAKK